MSSNVATTIYRDVVSYNKALVTKHPRNSNTTTIFSNIDATIKL